jgi:putative flavoprotein involved in K+ transport
MTSVHTVDTVVVGAGHAGLAVSHELTRAGREHVVLERGRVGERWRSERWDSLRLLTPNWMTRLPGWYYAGPEPEGFLQASRFAQHLHRYAASFRAPVLEGTTVKRLTAGIGDSYWVHTDHATWRTGSVVVASGPYARPIAPRGIERAEVHVLPSNRYRNPQQLAPGGVLVVGASSSGVQIADELVRAGRDVVLAVGRHTRMPRQYRGIDVFWWLDATGRLARTIDQVPDAEAARREPSLQLTGHDRIDLDLRSLRRAGVRLTGHLDRIDGSTASFRDDLASTVADADLRLDRFLDSLDRYVDRAGLNLEVLPASRPAPVSTSGSPSNLDLRREGIWTVVLAAGHRPEFPFVDLPITAADGSIRQNRGVTDAPGVYVVGQRFQHRRDSGFIDGARHDTQAVVTHLTTGALPAPTRPRGDAVTAEEQT